jgi:hypothetical protein
MSIINDPIKSNQTIISNLNYSIIASPLLKATLNINDSSVEISGPLLKWTDFLKGISN